MPSTRELSAARTALLDRYTAAEHTAAAAMTATETAHETAYTAARGTVFGSEEWDIEGAAHQAYLTAEREFRAAQTARLYAQGMHATPHLYVCNTCHGESLHSDTAALAGVIITPESVTHDTYCPGATFPARRVIRINRDA